MKKSYLFPLTALAALSSTADAKVHNNATGEDVDLNKQSASDQLAQKQLRDAIQKGFGIYPMDDDLFAFTIEEGSDGTLVAQHRSHYSHRSHSSHRSHYSSR